MSTQPPLTRMTHSLPLERLGPADFERLCLWLVKREGYEQTKALGEAGSEQGRDIVARQDGRDVAFQCKRVRRFGPKDALAEIKKIRSLPVAEQPDDLIFLVTVAVSTKTREGAREAWGNGGKCSFWAGSELDEKIKQHQEILEEFFDLGQRRYWHAVAGFFVVAVSLIVAWRLAPSVDKQEKHTLDRLGAESILQQNRGNIERCIADLTDVLFLNYFFSLRDDGGLGVDILAGRHLDSASRWHTRLPGGVYTWEQLVEVLDELTLDYTAPPQDVDTSKRLYFVPGNTDQENPWEQHAVVSVAEFGEKLSTPFRKY